MKQKNWSAEKRLAVAALLLNVMELPGLGSVVAGVSSEGWKQIAVFAIGLLISITGKPIAVIGMALMLISWISGLMTGMKLIKKSR